MSENPNPKINYVNNNDFNNEIISYYERKKLNPTEKIPDSIGNMLMKMAIKLASRYNFQNYTYRDEFIFDGILRCVEVFGSFDPNKSANPFGYFTTVLFNSYRQRIKKEKAERSMRDNLIMTQEIYSMIEGDDCSNFNRDIMIGDYQFDSNGN